MAQCRTNRIHSNSTRFSLHPDWVAYGIQNYLLQMGEGSLHLDLTRMGKVSVDTASMEMTAEPGANFKTMYEKADDSGVLVVGGMCPTVGPVGYALGGGHGTKREEVMRSDARSDARSDGKMPAGNREQCSV